jgi:hypothetical protein
LGHALRRPAPGVDEDACLNGKRESRRAVVVMNERCEREKVSVGFGEDPPPPPQGNTFSTSKSKKKEAKAAFTCS